MLPLTPPPPPGLLATTSAYIELTTLNSQPGWVDSTPRQGQSWVYHRLANGLPYYVPKTIEGDTFTIGYQARATTYRTTALYDRLIEHIPHSVVVVRYGKAGYFYLTELLDVIRARARPCARPTILSQGWGAVKTWGLRLEGGAAVMSDTAITIEVEGEFRSASPTDLLPHLTPIRESVVLLRKGPAHLLIPGSMVVNNLPSAGAPSRPISGEVVTVGGPQVVLDTDLAALKPVRGTIEKLQSHIVPWVDERCVDSLLVVPSSSPGRVWVCEESINVALDFELALPHSIPGQKVHIGHIIALARIRFSDLTAPHLKLIVYQRTHLPLTPRVTPADRPSKTVDVTDSACDFTPDGQRARVLFEGQYKKSPIRYDFAGVRSVLRDTFHVVVNGATLSFTSSWDDLLCGVIPEARCSTAQTDVVKHLISITQLPKLILKLVRLRITCPTHKIIWKADDTSLLDVRFDSSDRKGLTMKAVTDLEAIEEGGTDLPLGSIACQLTFKVSDAPTPHLTASLTVTPYLDRAPSKVELMIDNQAFTITED